MHSKQKIPQGMRESTPVERTRTWLTPSSEKQESTVLYVWNAKGDDFGTPYFGVMGEGGYVPVGTVDQVELSVASSEDEMQSYQRETLRAFKSRDTELKLNLAAVHIANLFDEIGRSQETRDEMAVCLEQSYSVFEYRHKFVWQYRRERKGNKANRRKRGRWQQLAIRTMIPNATVTDIRQPLSADAFAPVEVTFERRPTS